MGVVVTDAEVTLADILSLRLAITEPLADGARLVLRQRGTGEERRVALGASGGRTRDAGVAVSLAPLDLAPGRWDAYLEQDGVRSRIQSVDPGFSLDRLDAYALGRRTLAYRAYRTRNGFLALKIDPAEPVADVRAVWFREGRFEVTGLLAYTGLDDDDQHRHATLALRYSAPIPGAADHKNSGHKDPGPVNRGHGGHGHGDQGHGDQGHGDSAATMRVAATVQGVRFHAALSLCDVIAAGPDCEGLWEPRLRVDGLDKPLALGARIDDVDGRRRRVHYPATSVDGVRIRPRYTVDDELRLEVGG